MHIRGRAGRPTFSSGCKSMSSLWAASDCRGENAVIMRLDSLWAAGNNIFLACTLSRPWRTAEGLLEMASVLSVFDLVLRGQEADLFACL